MPPVLGMSLITTMLKKVQQLLWGHETIILNIRVSNKCRTSDEVWCKYSDAQCRVSLYLTVMTDMFLSCKNTLAMRYIILLCQHYLLFYSFIILFMILCVFFSRNVRCCSYKEFFGYSFYVKIFFNFITPDNIEFF